MTQTLLGKLRQSIFPDFPRSVNIANKDGSMTVAWHLALSNLFQNLQKNYSNEGLAIPLLSEADMDSIQQIYTNLIGKTLGSTNPTTPDNSGKMIYDIDNEVPKIFIIKFETAGDPSTAIKGGVDAPEWKTFTVT